jgi:hypothetical protein
MMTWLKLALALVALLQWVTRRLDEEKRKQVLLDITEKVFKDEIDRLLVAMRDAERMPSTDDTRRFREE